ncbi:hypothetical protein ACGH2B_11780 [Streptomyces sp. BBFR2]|uniref:hypothetical protein n=1 Tax=Streptomyces sp. BBFR2 TaxID=3372854 RepID=UPI0037DA3CAB
MNGDTVDPARAHSGAGDPGGPGGAGDFLTYGSDGGDRSGPGPSSGGPGWAHAARTGDDAAGAPGTAGAGTGPGGTGPGSAGSGGPDADPGDGFGGEDALRRLLHSSVGDLEPAPDALDHLRHAVPARRRRRRHAVVGAAAALLLGGTSIPAMVQVAHLDDAPGDRPVNAAGNRGTGPADGAPDGDPVHPGQQPSGTGGGTGGTGRPDGGHGRPATSHRPGDGPGAGSPDPYETMDVTSPACGRDQLGKGTGSVTPADAKGRVYGAFRVVNTSATACSVDGGGTVDVTPQGSADAARIHVVDHTSGDEATGLPDPATAPDQLVLKPGQAYEVKFAWIPASGGCAGTPPSPTPSPSSPAAGSPAAADGNEGTGGGQGGTTPGGNGGGSGGDGAAPGAIVLSHTPEAGEPAAADTTLTDACAGTVYRTGILNEK